MPLLPFGVTLDPPTLLGRYGFGAGVAAVLEGIANSFAGLTGYSQVPIDDDISSGDAARIVEIQRYLYDRYECASASRKALLARFEEDLDQAAADAKAEKGLSVTAEQMWVSDNQNSLIEKLPAIRMKIALGTLKPCTNWGTVAAVGGLVVVGAMVLGGGKRKR